MNPGCEGLERQETRGGKREVRNDRVRATWNDLWGGLPYSSHFTGRKRRPGEVKSLVPSPTAGEWQDWDLNTRPANVELRHLSERSEEKENPHAQESLCLLPPARA